MSSFFFKKKYGNNIYEVTVASHKCKRPGVTLSIKKKKRKRKKSTTLRDTRAFALILNAINKPAKKSSLRFNYSGATKSTVPVQTRLTEFGRTENLGESQSKLINEKGCGDGVVWEGAGTRKWEKRYRKRSTNAERFGRVKNHNVGGRG